MDRYPWVIPYAVVVVVSCLAAVVIIVVGTMVHGLFDARVDNKDIFAVIGPAFQSVIGGFVSLLGGITGYIVGKMEHAPKENG
jgi:hypothetical protein